VYKVGIGGRSEPLAGIESIQTRPRQGGGGCWANDDQLTSEENGKYALHLLENQSRRKKGGLRTFKQPGFGTLSFKGKGSSRMVLHLEGGAR